jgi:excisionase family DNA binding protein
MITSNPFQEISDRLSKIETCLLELKKAPGIVDSSADQIFSIDETAEFLHIQKNTIYSYVSRGLIPHSKRAGKLYFSKNDLIEWIKQGNTRPFDPEKEVQKIMAKRAKKKGGDHAE